MMETVSVLRLNQQQVTQLMTHLVAYRSYLWQAVLPTPERNQMIRTIQALQGRLEPLQAQGQVQGAITVSREEGSTLKQVLGELMKHYGAAASPARPNQTLSEIAGLHLLVERSLRNTQAL
ncbi:MAG TPA: hypothetical protein VFV38_20800 [Ktedonobacteraceae bacterium]|nr:hypothetical protein [Ktedonobacteraceae bacterium]